MMTHLHPTEPIAEFEMTIPSAQINRFFEAVAWQLPTRPAIPPTLATVFRKGEFLALEKFNIPIHNVLHGEQKYRFFQELQPDVPYKGQTYLMSHYEKSGTSGSMNFYVVQTNIKTMGGDQCLECSTTIIVRGSAKDD